MKRIRLEGRKEWDPRDPKPEALPEPTHSPLEDAVREAFVEVYGQPRDSNLPVHSILRSDTPQAIRTGWTPPRPNVVLIFTEHAWVQDPWRHNAEYARWERAMELLRERGFNTWWESINPAVHMVIEETPERRLGGATLGLPPAFQRITVGPLRFDFIRDRGILREVRVWATPSDTLVVRFKEPRLQPVQTVIQKILEDLYITAMEPDRIRDLADRMEASADHKRFLEGMIEWGSQNRGAIMAAAAELMPGMVRRRPR